MKLKLLIFFAIAPSLFAAPSPPVRIGHTTLTPRHSNPDDKGMYASAIDPKGGYAYFAGTYLFKLDITTPLPTQVGAALFIGQYASAAIDVSASYIFFPGASLLRYSLGAGANPVTAAGSLTLSAGKPSAVVVDDSDPDPANHYLYAICSGTSPNPATVVKVSVSTFTEVGSITLGPLESQFLLAPLVDPSHGYAYFISMPTAASPIPQVVKIKMTKGNAPPVRIGAVGIDSVGTGIDGGSIDPNHGYAYYGTYDSDPSIPGRVYKIKLEAGDVPPSLVGHISLHAGEGRLAASVIDPENGFVYFANDNTYPGGVYQLSLNGSLLPIEVSYTAFQAGPVAPPPNGTTAQNTTTDPSGILPYGEVFFRSGAFDPIRHFAYFGQDSRPNQIVKVQLPTRPNQLLNISTRGSIPSASSQDVLIGGFTVRGSNTKNLALRGIGPSLTSLGISGALPDPFLELHDSNSVLASNDNWRQAANSSSIPASLQPANDLESEIFTALVPSAPVTAYTVILQNAASSGPGTGIGLYELYDLNPDEGSSLVNISTRGHVGTNNNVLIGGFITGGGTDPCSVLIRAIGPSLSNSGITNPLPDPSVELRDSNGVLLASNDNWKDSQQAAITQTGLPPGNDLESALLTSLPAGSFTAIVKGTGPNADGIALVEIYDVTN